MAMRRDMGCAAAARRMSLGFCDFVERVNTQTPVPTPVLLAHPDFPTSAPNLGTLGGTSQIQEFLNQWFSK